MKYLNSKWSIPVAIIVLSLLAVLLPFYFNFQTHNTSPLISDWGSFGDYIGGLLGVIISGIAIFLLWQTYMLQKEELSKTAETLNFQNTTQILFQLLKKKDEMIDSAINQRDVGLVLFRRITRDTKNAYDARQDVEHPNRILESLLASTDNHTRPIVKRYIGIIRAINNILNPVHIDQSEDMKTNQVFLINLFRDYLSNEEKNLLSYFIWWDEFEQVREFLIKNGIVENITE
jgi:hypothetical protein